VLFDHSQGVILSVTSEDEWRCVGDIENYQRVTSMHPVLKSALTPMAEQIKSVTLEEAQIHQLPGHGRWCAQQVIEHLILTYKLTSNSVSYQLKLGLVPKRGHGVLKLLLRMQTIGVGQMPDGVPCIRAVRPDVYTPEAGPAIAARFLRSAEEMDALLVQARKKFGVEACGEHPFFGVLRVDEWRRYHAVHAEHHSGQLARAIRYARQSTTEQSGFMTPLVQEEIAPNRPRPVRVEDLGESTEADEWA
jgi:Protein of unknown function (DUF1569)